MKNLKKILPALVVLVAISSSFGQFFSFSFFPLPEKRKLEFGYNDYLFDFASDSDDRFRFRLCWTYANDQFSIFANSRFNSDKLSLREVVRGLKFEIRSSDYSSFKKRGWRISNEGGLEIWLNFK